MMKQITRINFFEKLGDKKATLAYFLQEGQDTCNANCLNCYAGAGEGAPVLERGIITPKVAYKDISELIKEFRVLIRGTEVLLNPQYIPLIKLSGDNTILTNGLVLGQHPERLNYLASNDISNIVFTYPFENNPSTESNINYLALKRKVIDKGLQEIKNHPYSFVLQVSTLVTKQSLTSLDEICEEARTLQANVIRFIPFTSQGDEQSPLALDRENRESLVEKVTELKLKYDKSRLQIHTPGVLGLFQLRGEKKQMVSRHITPQEQLICPAGLSYFAISAIKLQDEKGAYRPITPCHFVMDLTIGKYRGENNLEIDEKLVDKIFHNIDRRDCYAQIRSRKNLSQISKLN